MTGVVKIRLAEVVNFALTKPANTEASLFMHRFDSKLVRFEADFPHPLINVIII